MKSERIRATSSSKGQDAQAKKQAEAPQNLELPIVSNWKRSFDGEPVQIAEFPIFSDISVSGEATCGPYRFLNPVASSGEAGEVTAAIVLRIVEHDVLYGLRERLSTEKSDTARYHGGDIVDEVCSLVALFLGARMRAGAMSRMFGGIAGGDPLGRPVGWWGKQAAPNRIAFRQRSPVVQSAMGHRSLDLLKPLSTIIHLKPKDLVGLVRAASLYNDALWLCESEPELSWLMLVSAIEVVAACWDSSRGEPMARLAASRPEFVKTLQALHIDVPALVAEEFKDSVGATKKFVEFCVAHLPTPPQQRPLVWSQIDWNEQFWRDALRKIYKYRSLALHAGIPFPAPLCEAPDRYPGESVPSERGTTALASARLGGTWPAKDLPVSLNTFQQFVRTSILTWIAATTWPKGSAQFYERRPLYLAIATRVSQVARDREVPPLENGTSG